MILSNIYVFVFKNRYLRVRQHIDTNLVSQAITHFITNRNSL